MMRRLRFGMIVLVSSLQVATAWPQALQAPTPAKQMDVPGIGIIDLDELPPELAERIQSPEDFPPPPESPPRNLSPRKGPRSGEIPEPMLQGLEDFPPAAKGEAGAQPLGESSQRELAEKIRKWDEQREQEIEKRLGEVRKYVPPGAYRKAWEHISHMPRATSVPFPSQPESNPSERLSFLLHQPPVALATGGGGGGPGYIWNNIGPEGYDYHLPFADPNSPLREARPGATSKAT